MCSTPKTNLSAKIPKTPFRSFMASMTLAQRKRFSEVANRAEARREIREQYQAKVADKDKLKNQNSIKISLFSKMKFLCDETIKLMG